MQPTTANGRLVDKDGKSLEDDKGFLLPPHRTFASIWNAISHTYSFRWDEAIKHSRENALAMCRDAFLMGCLQERMLQLAELDFDIEPEDARNKQCVAEARKLKQIVQRTDRWVQFLMQLAWATWYGRYGNQVVWDRDLIFGKPAWVVKTHSPLNGDKINFGWDGVPRVNVSYTWIAENAPPGSLLEQQGLIENYPDPAMLRDALDPDKPIIYGEQAPMLILKDPRWRQRFVIHKHLCIDADYFEGDMAGGMHGVGLRSMVYWFFFLRAELLGWALNHMKKIGVGGILVFYYEEGNPDAKTAAEDAAKDAGERYALAMPRPRGASKETAQMEFLPFNESGVQAMSTIIESYIERHIERLIIGQSLSSKAEATGLGSSVASLHAGTKYRILKFDAMNLGDTLTADLLRVAQRFNCPNSQWRHRFVFKVPDPDATGKIASAVALFQTGMEFRADFLRGLIGAEKPQADDETISQQRVAEVQADLQLKVAQAQMQMQLQAQMQGVAAGDAGQAASQPAGQGESPKPPDMGGGQDSGGPADQPLKLPDLHPNQKLVESQADEAPLEYAEHAPAGGVMIAGKSFQGGQFIPARDLARATPEELAVLRAKHGEHRENIAGRHALEAQRQQQQAQGEYYVAQKQKTQEELQQAFQEFLAQRDQEVQQQTPAGQTTQGQPDAGVQPIVPGVQLHSLLRFASTRIRHGEHQVPIMQAVERLSRLPKNEYARAAGRAYQASAKAAAQGMITQDTIDANAFRLIEKFRWSGEQAFKGELGNDAQTKAALQGFKVAGSVARGMAKPILRQGMFQAVKPLMTEKPSIRNQVLASGAQAASLQAARGIGKVVENLPRFIRWLRESKDYQAPETPVAYKADGSGPAQQVVTFDADGRMVVYSESDWVHVKGEHGSTNKWVNIHSGNVRYSDKNPGTGKPHATMITTPNYDPEAVPDPTEGVISPEKTQRLLDLGSKGFVQKLGTLQSPASGVPQDPGPRPPDADPRQGKDVYERRQLWAMKHALEKWEADKDAFDRYVAANPQATQPPAEAGPKRVSAKEARRGVVDLSQKAARLSHLEGLIAKAKEAMSAPGDESEAAAAGNLVNRFTREAESLKAELGAAGRQGVDVLDPGGKLELLKHFHQQITNAQKALEDPASKAEERAAKHALAHFTREEERLRARLEAAGNMNIMNPRDRAWLLKHSPVIAQQSADDTAAHTEAAVEHSVASEAVKEIADAAAANAEPIALGMIATGQAVVGTIVRQRAAEAAKSPNAAEQAAVHEAELPVIHKVAEVTHRAAAHAAHHAVSAVAADVAHEGPEAAEAVKAVTRTVSHKAGETATSAVTRTAASVATRPAGVMAIVLPAAAVAASAFTAYHVGRAGYRAAVQAGKQFDRNTAALAAIRRDQAAITTDGAAHGRKVAMALAGVRGGFRDYFRNFTTPGLIGQAFGAW